MRDEAISQAPPRAVPDVVTATPALPPTGRLAATRRDLATRLGEDRLIAIRELWGVFVWTRALIFAIAVVAARVSTGSGSGSRFVLDVPGLTKPFGGFLGAIFSPLARWDATWYLGIAHNGYTGAAGGASRSTAFFPLYPLAIRLAGGLSHSPAVLLVASYVVSLACFAGALYLIHRLVTLELGRAFARPTLFLISVFPAALFFGAPYSESLFLLLSVGAFYAARTGRFALAGGVAAAASATRSEGILLMIPIAILYLYGPRTDGAPSPPGPGRLRALMPRYRLRPDALYILLAPLGIAIYSLHLALSVGDGVAFMHFEHEWFRSFAGPLGGVWTGTVAAFDGILQFASGSRTHHYFAAATGSPFDVAGHNVALFVFLVFAVVATVGVCRRLPLAYGAFVAASLALPLSYPVTTQPLMSLPRFIAVLFPIFMWLALVTRTRRRRDLTIALMALGLGIFTVQFATWHWVA